MRDQRRLVAWLCLLGPATARFTSAETPPAPKPPVIAAKSEVLAMAPRAELEPVIQSHATINDKVRTLRLAPHIATSIRMPEAVKLVVLGDPDKFRAEHSEHEPELVTVKPISRDPSESNLLITIVSGRQVNLMLTSSGEQASGVQVVDVLLQYDKPAAGSFVVEENPTSEMLIAETRKMATDPVIEREAQPARGEKSTAAGLVTAVKSGSAEPVLDKLLERQRQAPLPKLYGQKPGEIEAGERVQAGISEVLDEGGEVAVLFSVVNPARHAIEIQPPQVQLGGKAKKKWTTAEQLEVVDFRLSTRRLGPGQRADGVVIFVRPSLKQSNETLFLQIADSGAVDKPALAPIGFGMSTLRGGSAK